MRKIILAAIVFAVCFMATTAICEITAIPSTVSALDLRSRVNVELLKARDELALKADSAATFTSDFLSGQTTLLGAIEKIASDIDGAVTISVSAPLALDADTGVLSVDPTFGLPHVASGAPAVGACNFNTTDKKIYCQTESGVYASTAMTLVE